MSKVTLRLGAGGFGDVLIDGKPIQTVAVGITSEAGEPTEVTLVLPPAELDIEVEVDEAHLFITKKQEL